MSTAFQDVKPWPGKAPAANAAIGHNKPPMDEEARASFDEALDQREGFRARVAALLSASERAVATNEDEAGRCGELVKQIRAASKVIDDTHTTVKAPYLAAGRAVDQAKTEMKGPLEAAKTKVEAKQTQYLREEEAKRQAEARRQREAEEARRREQFEEEQRKAAALAAAEPSSPPIEVAPPAPVMEPEPERQLIRGDYGAAVSGTKVWTATVQDYEVAFIAAGLARNEKVREAIDKAIANQVRGGVREIEGVLIRSDIKASNR